MPDHIRPSECHILDKFFFFWHVNLLRLINAKAVLVEGQKWYYLTPNWRGFKVCVCVYGGGVILFPRVLIQK